MVGAFLYTGDTSIWAQKSPENDTFGAIRVHFRVHNLQNIDFQCLCGVTGNRTRDTRIFSPLLYQLSYDTIFSMNSLLLFWDCKDRQNSSDSKFFRSF